MNTSEPSGGKYDFDAVEDAIAKAPQGPWKASCVNALSEWNVYCKNSTFPISNEKEVVQFAVYAMEEMPLMLEILRNYEKALRIALETIHGLSEQQAMRDDSYMEDVKEIKKLMGEGENVRTSG
jgi:hypothetical protein